MHYIGCKNKQWSVSVRSSETNLFLMVQSFLYLIWYTTMSILGHYNNFFFAAHLLDIAMGFKTLRTILSSVTHNGKQASLYHQVVHERQPLKSKECVCEPETDIPLLLI